MQDLPAQSDSISNDTDSRAQSDAEASSSETSPPPVNMTAEEVAVAELVEETANRQTWEAFHRRKQRRFRWSVALFVLTFLSTTLVGADFWPLDIVSGFFNEKSRILITEHLDIIRPSESPMSLTDRFWESIGIGCLYSISLMMILFCHEMGHYIQAVRYRVPASFPYFIPLPLPPLGTMGAVILQGRGVANRKQMFDIAVTGPLAGLLVTMPILCYGIYTSGYVPEDPNANFEFGRPLLLKWLIEFVHGVQPDGMTFHWNGFAHAGWVGVFVTAMNLLPIGQLDGGHILYTLIGRKAHWIAWGLILSSVALMIYTQLFSYVLLLILLTLTGPRHPPTADDSVPLGKFRHFIGWGTLSFLVIGFTLQPIIIPETRPGERMSPAPDSMILPIDEIPMESSAQYEQQ